MEICWRASRFATGGGSAALIVNSQWADQDRSRVRRIGPGINYYQHLVSTCTDCAACTDHVPTVPPMYVTVSAETVHRAITELPN